MQTGEPLRHSFAAAQLVPKPTFLSGSWNWTPAPDQVNVSLVFDQVMNTSIVPALASFKIWIDGADSTPDSVAWSGPSTLLIHRNKAAPPPAIVAMQLLVEDPNLRDNVFGATVDPFLTPNLPVV